MASEITSTDIATAATDPKKVEGDEGVVEMHPLTDQIAADKYLRGRNGVRHVTRGIRFGKMLMPGHTGNEEVS